ncbi:hypothetical protein TSOC_012786 [Tetrabaena socialis]|uniref:Uncharacterized protein n=1 Tax=Tetrabaena socialis TaxID=47790 RepID=A0A2J7ZM28_9CHLO|nr:hypothetical protein TSOC_012786 [Tetrabaena socialis]|eukprot:PNH01328.1 hypothetical protein TSOC_012786 [Tetrabaena socialis]
MAAAPLPSPRESIDDEPPQPHSYAQAVGAPAPGSGGGGARHSQGGGGRPSFGGESYAGSFTSAEEHHDWHTDDLEHQHHPEHHGGVGGLLLGCFKGSVSSGGKGHGHGQVQQQGRHPGGGGASPPPQAEAAGEAVLNPIAE